MSVLNVMIIKLQIVIKGNALHQLVNQMKLLKKLELVHSVKIIPNQTRIKGNVYNQVVRILTKSLTNKVIVINVTSISLQQWI